MITMSFVKPEACTYHPDIVGTSSRWYWTIWTLTVHLLLYLVLFDYIQLLFSGCCSEQRVLSFYCCYLKTLSFFVAVHSVNVYGRPCCWGCL